MSENRQQPPHKNSKTAKATVKQITGMGLLISSLTILIFAAALISITLYLRDNIRTQIIQREGIILQALTQAELSKPSALRENQTAGSFDDPLTRVLLTSQLPQMQGVLGFRIFDAQGSFVDSFPAYISKTNLVDYDFDKLLGLTPISRYNPNAKLDDHILLPPSQEAKRDSSLTPLLTVTFALPEQNGGPEYIVQYLIEGNSVSSELAMLDQYLFSHVTLILILGAILIAITVGWAFNRLQKANLLLSERTRKLLYANDELALAAKTNAVGALTSHLLHGLRNPLSGLQNFVASWKTQFEQNGLSGQWREAADSTERMNNLVNEIVRILQDQQSTTNYEISLTELRGLTTERIRPVLQEKDIRIEGDVKINASLEIRHANIIMLILDNLLRNAVHACPPRSQIDLSITSGDDAIDFTVADQGPGLPEHVIEHLFLPCKSTKPGAGGIGLAISKQLSAHLDANLEFTGNIPTGCRFVLSVPKNLFKDYNS